MLVVGCGQLSSLPQAGEANAWLGTSPPLLKLQAALLLEWQTSAALELPVSLLLLTLAAELAHLLCEVLLALFAPVLKITPASCHRLPGLADGYWGRLPRFPLRLLGLLSTRTEARLA
mmetsp:Transcript_136547/g.380605  ORF Transcript_136547/g.380605 Transcript_136547/m.380605 type:complete len:118 (-) Transcript_136547:527-880(-)